MVGFTLENPHLSVLRFPSLRLSWRRSFDERGSVRMATTRRAGHLDRWASMHIDIGPSSLSYVIVGRHLGPTVRQYLTCD